MGDAEPDQQDMDWIPDALERLGAEGGPPSAARSVSTSAASLLRGPDGFTGSLKDPDRRMQLIDRLMNQEDLKVETRREGSKEKPVLIVVRLIRSPHLRAVGLLNAPRFHYEATGDSGFAADPREVN